MGRGRHRIRRFGRGTTVLLAVAALLLVGLSGTAYAAYRYDRSRSGLILPGIRVQGIAVGDMTRDQAIRAVTALTDRTLNQPIAVEAAGRTWNTTLGGLGLTVDVPGAVDQAMGVGDSFSWLSRTYHRIADKPVQRSFAVTFSRRPGSIKAFVAQVAKAVARPAVDASFGLESGHLQTVHAKPGRALRSSTSATLLARAVNDRSGTVELPLAVVKPKVTDEEVGKTIVVNVSANTLSLYDGFRVIRSYPVATAKAGFLTPDGSWKVVAKVENPSWHNPDPTGWGAGEPLVIPPGPSNPLGTRALYLDASGIRIHGTPDDGSIGTYASHGCIRMHISDSEALYPLVPVGTPVFIIGAPPWGATSDPGVAG